MISTKPKQVLRPKKRFVDESDTNSESDDLDDLPSSEVFLNSKIAKDGKFPINQDFLDWQPYEQQMLGKGYKGLKNQVSSTSNHSTQFLVLKTTLRAIHMMSGSFTAGTVILNAFFGVNDLISEMYPHYEQFRLFVAIVMILAGIVNVFLIKYGKNLLEHQKLWLRFFELKLVMALALTPMVDPVLYLITDDEWQQEIIRQKIQLLVIVFTLVFSSFIRYYREEKCASFESDEQLASRVMKLQEKLQNKSSKGEPIDLVKPDMKKYLGEELGDLMQGKKVDFGSDSDMSDMQANSDDSNDIHIKDSDADDAQSDHGQDITMESSVLKDRNKAKQQNTSKVSSEQQQQQQQPQTKQQQAKNKQKTN